MKNRVTAVLFVVYMVVLFWILLFKLGVQFSYMGKRSVNLIPFREAILYGKVDITEIILNVVIFVPLGIYAGVLYKQWRMGAKLLFVFLVSCMFEAIQFIFSIGAFDITDIITNTSGGMIGLILFGAIEKLAGDNVKAHRFINVIAGLGTAFVVSLLVLLKLDMLPVKYR